MLYDQLMQLRERAKENRGISHEIKIPGGYCVSAMMTQGAQIARIEVYRSDNGEPAIEIFQIVAILWGFPALKPERVIALTELRPRWVATWTGYHPPKDVYKDFPAYMIDDVKQSDRMFAEARLLEILGESEEAESLRASAFSKFNELIASC